MKKRDPKRTFAKGTFGRFARKHGIEFRISPFDPEKLDVGPMVRKTDIFVASLKKGDKVYTQTLQFTKMFDYLPEIDDVLENIANSIGAFRYYQREPMRAALTFGYHPGDPRFLAMMEGVKDVDASMRLFLGDEAYNEFVTITEVRGPMIEPL